MCILSDILYGNNIRATLDDVRSINRGSVYESVVDSELIAHGHKLFYYDNRSRGEVDYLIDDYESLSEVLIEIKSGKDYSKHAALSNVLANEAYAIPQAYVFHNGNVSMVDKVCYYPIYMLMFVQKESQQEGQQEGQQEDMIYRLDLGILRELVINGRS